MWQPVPGGSPGHLEVASRLAAQGVRAVGIAARHGGQPTEEVGLTFLCSTPAAAPPPVQRGDRLSMPRAWTGCSASDRARSAGRDHLGDSPTSRLVVTVHDIAFPARCQPLHLPTGPPSRALDITKHRADGPRPSERPRATASRRPSSHGLTHAVTDSQVEGFLRPDPPPSAREPRKNLPTLCCAPPRHGLVHGLDLVLVGPAGWGEDPEWEDHLPPNTHVLGRLDDADLACAMRERVSSRSLDLGRASGCPGREAMATAPRRHQRRHLYGRDHGHDAGLVPATDAVPSPTPWKAAAGSTTITAAGLARAPTTRETSAAAHARLYRRWRAPSERQDRYPGAGVGGAARRRRVVLVNWKNAPDRAARSIA